MKRITILFLVILILGISGLVWAHPGYNSNSDIYNQDLEKEIVEVRDKYYNQKLDLQEKLREKQLELNELYFDSTIDNNEIREKEKELNNIENQLEELRIEERLEIRDNLSEQQLENFARYGNITNCDFPAGGLHHFQNFHPMNYHRFEEFENYRDSNSNESFFPGKRRFNHRGGPGHH